MSYTDVSRERENPWKPGIILIKFLITITDVSFHHAPSYVTSFGCSPWPPGAVRADVQNGSWSKSLSPTGLLQPFVQGELAQLRSRLRAKVLWPTKLFLSFWECARHLVAMVSAPKGKSEDEAGVSWTTDRKIPHHQTDPCPKLTLPKGVSTPSANSEYLLFKRIF